MPTKSSRARNKTTAAGQYLAIPPPEHLWFLDPIRLSWARCTAVTGRQPRTLARWRSRGIADPACLRLLQIEAYGLIPGPSWREWHVDPSGAIAPWMAGARHPTFHPAHLASLAGILSGFQEARAEAARLRADLAALTAPPAGDPPQMGLFLAT